MAEKKAIDSIVERAIERVLADSTPVEQQKQEAEKAESRRRPRRASVSDKEKSDTLDDRNSEKDHASKNVHGEKATQSNVDKQSSISKQQTKNNTAAQEKQISATKNKEKSASKENHPNKAMNETMDKQSTSIKKRKNTENTQVKQKQTTVVEDKQRKQQKNKSTDKQANDKSNRAASGKAEGSGNNNQNKSRYRQSSVSRLESLKQQMRKQDELSSSHVFVSNPLASNPVSRRMSFISATNADMVKANNDKEGKLKIIPLGGMGEVGKNMTLIQYGEDILIVDAGVMFPDENMLGIDLVIPDYSYLIEHKENVLAYLLTHGHEDHIGGMPYLLKDINAPVYGSRLTLGLLKGKLTENKVDADLRQVAPRENINIGSFKVEFFRISHSIPDAMGLAIHTPLGIIMIVSDFKMDTSPIDGQLMDFSRITALGERGVLLLMSDSTNVEREGFTDSERSVGLTFDRLFSSAKGRIILTSFASNVHRIQQALWSAEKSGRKVAVVGRGMQNVTMIAKELGYLNIPENTLIDIEKVNNMPANKVVILTTGSQGEPLSGLTRMSSGEHRQVHIIPGDMVIISATPIPGNERTVARTVDNLFRQGAIVVHERNQGIHVSGHASKEELKILINMVRPRFFLPMHGEYRMLYKHARLAQNLGIPEENTFVMENGQVLEVGRRHCRINGVVPSGRVLIDGLGVGDVGNYVLKERKQLAESGVIIVNLVYTKKTKPHILVGPEIISRGFIFEKEYEHIIGEAKEKVAALCTDERLIDGSLHDLRNQLRSVLSRFVQERTGRKPAIIEIVNEV